ncbi:MAG: Maf family protein [Candidatus Omnitrophica bacterium]|nr:Maf family protein [Candidatus Omnitrophota bacterium]
MREVILASRSKARQKCLRQVGIKFRVSASRVKEQHILKTTCSRLVIENALSKARDVAKRYKKGIVVAADTVVLASGRIIGKPKSMNDARKTLKLLSRKPQRVYTGIAVIDIDRNKIFTDYEKTKIYMVKMTDSDISDYFKRTSPLDKAGSFDIQGRGAKFIKRIDGCFDNVVGLPITKLKKILKEINEETGR